MIDRKTDGGLIILSGLPEGTGNISASVFLAPNTLVTTAADGLWTVALDPLNPAYMQLRARPLPGFPITSIALEESKSGGAFQGYLISSNRLFVVDAPTLNRVNVSEVPLVGDDPVQVWFDGSPGARRGRVLMRSGALALVAGPPAAGPGACSRR